MPLDYKTTADIKIAQPLVEQIIGQEEAVKMIKKAGLQRRNVLLIGEPGTGKSLTGQALAELLPDEDLVDILALPNIADENNPLIKPVPKGQGKEIVTKAKMQVMGSIKNQNIIFFILIILAVISPWWVRKVYGDIIAAATIISSMIFLASFVVFMSLNRRAKISASVPKLLIDNGDKKKAPFIDATGTHAGALLGDCLHDPLQSFFTTLKLIQINQDKNLVQVQEKEFNQLVDPLFEKKKNDLIKEGTYEAFFTEKNELNVLGHKNNQIEEAEVLSANRYQYQGDLVKIRTEKGKEIVVTPKHKVAVQHFGRIFYKEAQKLTRFDNIVALDLN